MRYTLIAAVASAVIGAGAVRAENGSAFGFHALTGTLIRSRCHMNLCGWFAIQETSLIAENARRSLFLVKQKNWSSYYPDSDYNRRRPRSYVGESRNYVVCSKVDPAVIDDYSGEWSEVHLTPGAEGGIFGAIESELSLYWATCHAMNVQDVFAATKIAGSLGYSKIAPDDPAEETKLKSPTDVMLDH